LFLLQQEGIKKIFISKSLIDLENIEPTKKVEQCHLQITNAIHKVTNEILGKAQKEKRIVEV
jgi:hypothetical protein